MSIAFATRLATVLLVIGLATGAVAQVCPPEGSPRPGGRPLSTAKIELNELKNRTQFPQQISSIRVVDVLNIPGQRNRILERRGIALEGYLLGYKYEGEESPNCYSTVRRDFHIWIGAQKPRTNEDARTMRARSGRACESPH